MGWSALVAGLSLAIVFSAQKTMAVQAFQTGGDIEPPYVECCRSSDSVRLRSGPGTIYTQVGILMKGEKAKAVGQSKGASWIQIVYTAAPGGVAWVSLTFVILYEGSEPLPTIQDPPTPTHNQATIDPTLAAQFSSEQPTRLPSFTPGTPPATVSLPLGDTTDPKGGIPPIILILGLLSLGTFGSILTATVIRR